MLLADFPNKGEAPAGRVHQGSQPYGPQPLAHSFETAVILSNAGVPVSASAGGSSQWLGRAETLLLPTALGRLEIAGPADVLMGYLPDLKRDVRKPLTAAG